MIIKGKSFLKDFSISKVVTIIIFSICLFKLQKAIYLFANYIKHENLFWDYKVYLQAFKNMLESKSPYLANYQNLSYFYPPPANYLIRGFFSIGEKTILITNFFCLLTFSIIPSLNLKKNKRDFLFFSICAISLLLLGLKDYGVKSLLTGNISLTLYLITLSPIILFEQKILGPKYHLEKTITIACISICACVKPYFLVFLSIFWFGSSKVNYLYFFSGIILFLILFINPFTISEMVIWFDTMTSYSKNFSNDLGFPLLLRFKEAIFFNNFSHAQLSIGTSLIYLVTLIIYFLLTKKDKKFCLWTFFTICLLCNPRPKEYDLFLIPFFFFQLIANTYTKNNKFIVPILLINSLPFYQLTTIVLPWIRKTIK